MIFVKSTSKQTKSNDPAEQFKLKDDPNQPRTPYILAGVFAALALYLKSSLASVASEMPAGPQKGARAPTEPDSPAPDDEQSQLGRMQGQRANQTAMAQEPSQSGAISPVGPATRFQNNALFDTNISQTIASARLNAANMNAPWSGPVDMIDMAQLFGSSANLNDAWTNDAAEGPFSANPTSSASDRNRAPRSNRPTSLFDVVSGGAIAIALSDLLANVTDANGDALRVGNVEVSSGSITAVAGGFIYRAAATDALGPVVLSYQVSDGKAVTRLSATFSVVPNKITGTSQDDNLAGGAAVDKIIGNDGNDNISALLGNDVIEGGAGNDTIFGGAGNDQLDGGDGNDIIFGGAGNDHLSGGAGNDRLLGEDGNDVMLGDDGNDAMLGGVGNDLLNGGAGNDTMTGDAGNDTVLGDTGNDAISDGAGADSIHGGAGIDIITAAQDTASDVYNGGAGHDTLDYSLSVSAVKIDLTTGIATGLGIGSDMISDFEVIKAGSGDDYILIGDDEVILIGGGGANVFEFIETVLINAPPMTIHQILDFGVGDVIKTGKFDIFKKQDDAAGSLFDALHGGNPNSGTTDVIRIRYEANEGQEDTVIEWDNSDCSEITVVKLNGHQVLMWADYD